MARPGPAADVWGDRNRRASPPGLPYEPLCAQKALDAIHVSHCATEQFTIAAAVELALLSGSWPFDRFPDSAFLMARKPDQRQLR